MLLLAKYMLQEEATRLHQSALKDSDSEVMYCEEVSHDPVTIIFITIILSSPSYLAFHAYFPIHHTA